MNILPEVSSLAAEMSEWRHHIHAHPETAFEESATAAFVADKLRSFGLEVHTGLARTGVVGVLRAGAGSHSTADAIGLRADLDALHIEERSGVPIAERDEQRQHDGEREEQAHRPGQPSSEAHGLLDALRASHPGTCLSMPHAGPGAERSAA